VRTTAKELSVKDFVIEKFIDTKIRVSAVIDPLVSNYFLTALGSGMFPRDGLKDRKENNILRTLMGAEAYDKRIAEEGKTKLKEQTLQEIGAEVRADEKAIKAFLEPEAKVGIKVSTSGLYEVSEATLGKDLLSSLGNKNNVVITHTKKTSHVWVPTQFEKVPKTSFEKQSKETLETTAKLLSAHSFKVKPKKEGTGGKNKSRPTTLAEARPLYKVLEELGTEEDVIDKMKSKAGKSLPAHRLAVMLNLVGATGEPDDDSDAESDISRE
jgi:hypothetical protein